MILGAKARTILQGRYAVSVEDIQALAPSVLRHRIFPNFKAQGEGLSSLDIISRLLSEVKPSEDGKAARLALRPVGGVWFIAQWSNYMVKLSAIAICEPLGAPRL